MRVCMADAQGILHNIHAVFALILDIVDGEHRFDAAVRFQVPVIQVQIHGHQRRLPVVGVDDVRVEVYMKQHLADGARKEGKALAVIIKAIQPGALEIVLIVQKIVFHAAGFQLEQAAVLVAPAHRHIEIGEIGKLFAVFFFHIAIQRQHHAACSPAALNSLRQAACHIAKAAGSGKRRSLAGTKQNVHINSPLSSLPGAQPALPAQHVRQWCPFPHIQGSFRCPLSGGAR